MFATERAKADGATFKVNVAPATSRMRIIGTAEIPAEALMFLAIGRRREFMIRAMAWLVLMALLAAAAGPVDAGRAAPVVPDVAEIEDFVYDECTNVVYWTATSEIIIHGYRIENPQAGWVSPFYNAANYGSTRPSSYALQGPDFCPACKHFPTDYWLRVYYDTGVVVMEDVAARACEWVPTYITAQMPVRAK